MNRPILYTVVLAAFLLAGTANAQQTKPAAKPKPAPDQAKPATATEPQTAARPQAAPANRKTPEQRAEEITTSMIKNLALTSAQINKVRQINLQSVEQMEAARAKHQKNPKAMVQEADLISRSRLSRLKDVLTEMQFQKYQKKREEEMGITQPVSPAGRRPDMHNYEQ